MTHENSKKENHLEKIKEICCSEHSQHDTTRGTHSINPRPKDRFLGVSIIVAGVILGGTVLYASAFKGAIKGFFDSRALANLEKTILPDAGVVLPVRWGDIGKKLIENGTIDQKKFEELYSQRGGLDDETRKLLTEDNNGKLVINKDNANVVLNLLWALGLANKNQILESGPITDKKYGGDAGKFASTGGWTLSTGKPMDHYSKHAMIVLTPVQQSLVEEVSKNIYRPCCGNSTYFPDCNHGMAMLGLLEVMASQGVGEPDMYKAALAVNSFWFPDNYLTIGQFLKSKGMSWENISPKGILGKEYSSGQGFQQIKNQVAPVEKNSSSSCGA